MTEVCGQVWNVLFAGYDAVSSVLSSAVFYVATHASVEDQLLSEIDSHPQNMFPTVDNAKDWPFARVRSTSLCMLSCFKRLHV